MTTKKFRELASLIKKYRPMEDGEVIWHEIRFDGYGIQYTITHDGFFHERSIIFAEDGVCEFGTCCALDILSGFSHDDEGMSKMYYELMTIWAKELDRNSRSVVALNGGQGKARRALLAGGFKVVYKPFKNPNSGNVIHILIK